MLYVFGATIYKWLIDHRMKPFYNPVYGPDYKSIGDEMWDDVKILYLASFIIWPIALAQLSIHLYGDKITGVFSAIAEKARDVMPEKGISDAYEDTYKNLTGK